MLEKVSAALNNTPTNSTHFLKPTKKNLMKKYLCCKKIEVQTIGEEVDMRIVQLPSFAKEVNSYERVDKMTRPNCLYFKMGQGMTREHIWKIIESIGFSTKQLFGIVDKKDNYVDITCQSRQNVLSLYEKLLNVDKISNLRLFEFDKITVAIHWVPVPFPIDRPKNYLETKHGSVSKHFAKLEKMAIY